jgi:hypothetical protein
VMLAAGDTFRAAAVEQLEKWAERTGAEFVKGAGVKSRPSAGRLPELWVRWICCCSRLLKFAVCQQELCVEWKGAEFWKGEGLYRGGRLTES